MSRTDSSGGVTFQYDALGNRVVRVEGGVYQPFIHDLSGRLPQVLTEMDSTGTVKVNYVYGLGLISRIDSIGNILYYHFNAQHNTIALSNDSGLVTDTYTYEDFGKMLSHTGTSDQPYTYLGQYGVEQESPTLYYMRARYYDAANHRFLSKDPYTITLENPQTINRYIYALNNPLEYSDPTGLYAEKDNQFSKGTRVLNGFQTVLDVAGLIPGFGEPLDALNALIYLARGDRLNFALSAAAVIPFLGWGATGGKLAFKAERKIVRSSVREVEVANRVLLSQYTESTLEQEVKLTMNNPTKLIHIFEKEGRNLGPLVDELGGRENFLRTVLNTLNGKLPSSGKISDVKVMISGQSVVIRGMIVDGMPRIGTIFLK